MPRKSLVDSQIAHDFVHNTFSPEEITEQKENNEQAGKNETDKQSGLEIVIQIEGKKNGDVSRKRITVDLPASIHHDFKLLATELGTDMNALINKMVETLVVARRNKKV